MERLLTIDGTRLALDDEGDGPALVCLHAIGHDAAEFVRLRRRLGGRWRVVAIDWPGQGRSPDDGRPPTAARYAALLDAALDALGIETCVVLGNSIGGAAAVILAARRPERVRALVLENAGGLAPVDDRVAQTFLRAMAAFFAAGRRGAWWYRGAFALYYRMVLQRPAAAETRARIVARARELAPLLEAAWRGFAHWDPDPRALAPGITCPVLAAWAERDRINQLGRSLPAIRSFPQGELVRFPAGHAAHVETPDAFEAVLERFLAALPPAAATSRRAAP